MTECMFCSVISSRDRATFVHDDDEVLAFMDRNPINKGHVLVIPRLHVADIQKLDKQIYLKIMLVAKRIALAFDFLYLPTKVGFAVAGLDIPHAHMHIIPLYDRIDIKSRYILEVSSKKPVPIELEDEAAKIRRFIENDLNGDV